MGVATSFCLVLWDLDSTSDKEFPESELLSEELLLKVFVSEPESIATLLTLPLFLDLLFDLFL
ncbi:12107_t:CDS:2 [Ambispora leptoticha]|uniref:12107_t:CDS:1 n=1 Tax=Ambispora leptoticha TaxID=144679 RepID=A0A9N8W7L0_9GLOM|nr:12107_t:CDS:2 [Ambispora leptoticha]